MDKLCTLAYEPAPEGVANYHAGAAHAILGEVMSRLDKAKRSINRILEEEIFIPAGMADTALSLKGRDDLRPRAAPIRMRDDSPDGLPAADIEKIAEICTEVEFLAGGAFSTAYDQFQLC